MQRLEVGLGARSYPILVGDGLLDRADAFDRVSGGTVLVVTNDVVAPLYLERVRRALGSRRVESVVLPDGERHKTLDAVARVIDALVAARVNRDGCVVALGGGVVGDVAGFAAACYQRGIDYVQVPTTLLAQVDSSVGGKTGVNHPGGKNLIGAFHQPRLVIADTATLATLPRREWNEGFAEIIKHAAIRDGAMLDAIEEIAHGKGDLAALIKRNIEIKARIVEQDEFETKGLRALLNFGHTIGHAIEAAATYGTLLHGEAISMGLVAALDLSTRLSTLPQRDASRMIALLRRFDLPVRLPEGMSTEALIRSLTHDKKFEDGQVRFVLLRSAGDAFVSHDVTLRDIESAIENLRSEPQSA